MPSDESAVLTELAKIAESQRHMAEEQKRQRDETSKVADTIGKVRHEATLGFGDVHSSLATVTEQLSGHRQETDRRFREHGGSIKRAHEAAAEASAAAGQARAKAENADGAVRESDIRRDAKVVGSASGLAILFERAVAWFTGGGAPPA